MNKGISVLYQIIKNIFILYQFIFFCYSLAILFIDFSTRYEEQGDPFMSRIE